MRALPRSFGVILHSSRIGRSTRTGYFTLTKLEPSTHNADHSLCNAALGDNNNNNALRQASIVRYQPTTGLVDETLAGISIGRRGEGQDEGVADGLARRRGTVVQPARPRTRIGGAAAWAVDARLTTSREVVGPGRLTRVDDDNMFRVPPRPDPLAVDGADQIRRRTAGVQRLGDRGLGAGNRASCRYREWCV